MGRGIDLIRRACVAEASSLPTCDCDSAAFRVEFPLPASTNSSPAYGVGEKTLLETPVKTPEAILQYLADNPTMTLAEVAGQMGKSLSTVQRANAKLVKDGNLKYIGPQKGFYQEVLT
ncbi:MAG: winged helix-turn-helix domain-containing protein [Janthinobacterium svalbardensis]